MDWIISAILVLATAIVLPMMLASGKRKGLPGSAMTGIAVGLAEVFDPKAAMIAEESEKRADMEGEDESGDGPAAAPDRNPAEQPGSASGKQAYPAQVDGSG